VVLKISIIDFYEFGLIVFSAAEFCVECAELSCLHSKEAGLWQCF